MNPLTALAYIKAEPAPDAGSYVVVGEDDFPAYSDLGNGLTVYYLLDAGEHFEYVQRKDLAAEGLAVEKLHEAAISNLTDLCSGRLEVTEYGNIYSVTVDGVFEASTLLLDWLWDVSLKDTISEEYVATIPARDVLGYCDSSSTVGISELRAVTERVWPDGDHLLTQTLYRRTGRAWIPYYS